MYLKAERKRQTQRERTSICCLISQLHARTGAENLIQAFHTGYRDSGLWKLELDEEPKLKPKHSGYGISQPK